MRRYLRMLCGAAAILALLSGRTLAAPSLSLKARLQTFELVWSRVKERHYDPKLNGVDWNAVHKRYAPLVRNAKNDTAFYQLLEQMLGELKQSHFAIIPPEADLAEEESKGKGHGGVVGITVQSVEGKPIITRVEPDSPAEKAGLRSGFVITRIDGKPLDKLMASLKARKLRPVERDLYLMIGVTTRLVGAVGEEAKITCLDADGKEMTVGVPRVEPKGEVSTFGQLPPIPVEFEKKRLPENVGYIRFSIFLMPALEKIRQAIGEMHDASGIIIDLRGNFGGIGYMAPSIAGMFAQRQGTLGTMKMRQGAINFIFYPVERPYKGPLVILTDEASLSTSEILAGSMQENHRAVVVGRKTGGMVLPSSVELLPGGARLQYAVADFKTPKGVLLEGKGVQPDIPVTLTRRDLLTGHDPVLDAALAYIGKKP